MAAQVVASRAVLSSTELVSSAELLGQVSIVPVGMQSVWDAILSLTLGPDILGVFRFSAHVSG
jgi:hypothetical protein